MKKWYCPECHNRRVSEDNIVFYECPCCVTEMELDEEIDMGKILLSEQASSFRKLKRILKSEGKIPEEQDFCFKKMEKMFDGK